MNSISSKSLVKAAAQAVLAFGMIGPTAAFAQGPTAQPEAVQTAPAAPPAPAVAPPLPPAATKPIAQAPDGAPAKARLKPVRKAAAQDSATPAAAKPAAVTTGSVAQTAAPVAAAGGSAAKGSGRCTRMAFEVNDYGKDGPTKDAKDLLDKHIAGWAQQKGIKKYTVGKKIVNCRLFLDFGVFDEHTCRAEAPVCW